MFGLGPTELIIVFTIIILFFGARRLPEIFKGLGKGINEFKKEIQSPDSSRNSDFLNKK